MIKPIAKYIHGSSDSIDKDIHYVVEEQPSFQEAKEFCDSDLSENRNIITIKDGIVTGCYKGTVDEINNALFSTYNKHEQEYPLMVTHLVERNKPLKYIRAVRGILSHLSRSQYRPEIKQALKSNWKARLDTLDSIDLLSIDFTKLGKNVTEWDARKIIAFQIGQSLALDYDKELYTKHDIAEEFPELKQFLYREEQHDDAVLQAYVRRFVKMLRDNYPVEQIDTYTVQFVNENRNYDLKYEKELVD